MPTISGTVKLLPLPVPTDDEQPDDDKLDGAKPMDAESDDDKPIDDKSVDDQPFATANDAMVPVVNHQDYSSCSLQGGGRHNQTFVSLKIIVCFRNRIE